MDALIDFILNFYGPVPYALIFMILLLCGFGLPLPEDIVLFVAGVLAYYGTANVWTMIIVALLGVLIGDSIVFFLGVRIGRKILSHPILSRLLHAERMESVKGSFKKRGNKIIFMARFMPGLRAPIFFSAGTLHVPFGVFLAYDASAALLSVPAIVYSVYYFGDELDRVISAVKNVEQGILIAIGVIIAIFLIKKWITVQRVPKA